MRDRSPAARPPARRGKAAPGPAAADLKARPRHTERHRQLEKALQQQRMVCDGLLQEHEVEMHREMVLLDMVLHQEQVLLVIGTRQEQQREAQQQAQQQQQQQVQPPQQQVQPQQQPELQEEERQGKQEREQNQQERGPQQEGEGPQQAPPRSASFVAGLLHSATPEQWRRAAAMTTADWSRFFTESFERLLLLLELGSRDEDSAAFGGAGAGAGGAAGAARGGSHRQQLEQLVDEWVRLSALSLLQDPVPLYFAMMLNHATQQRAAPPAGHWARVVRRLRLSRQQTLHFYVALREIWRLDASVVQRGSELAHHAGGHSILVLAAQAQRGGGGGWRDGSPAGGRMASPPAASSTACRPGSEREAAASERGEAPGQAARDSVAASASSPPRDGRADRELQAPVEVQLQRNVGRMPLHSQLLMAFNCSTLTRLQIARCMVASYPWLPMTGSVAYEAAQLYLQQDTQPLWQQQQQRRQQQHQQQAWLQRQRAGVEDEACLAGSEDLCCTWEDEMTDALRLDQLAIQRQRQAQLNQQRLHWWEGALQAAAAPE